MKNWLRKCLGIAADKFDVWEQIEFINGIKDRQHMLILELQRRIHECERRLDQDNASIQNLANRPVCREGKPAKKLVRK